MNAEISFTSFVCCYHFVALYIFTEKLNINPIFPRKDSKDKHRDDRKRRHSSSSDSEEDSNGDDKKRDNKRDAPDEKDKRTQEPSVATVAVSILLGDVMNHPRMSLDGFYSLLAF